MSDHAVIVQFEYAVDDLDPLHELEARLAEAIASAGVGEFDGHEIAIDGSDGRLFMYGPDADVLFNVVEPVLITANCIRDAAATLRYGPPEDGVRERTVAIETAPDVRH